MKTVVVVLIVFLLFFSAAAVDAAEFEISRGISQMIWKEYDFPSQKLFMEENGLIQSGDFYMLSKVSKNFSSRLGLEFFFANNVNFMGKHMQDLSSYNTTGFWAGVAIEESMEYKIKIQKDFYISPLFSLAVSDWQRQVSGENWLAVVGKVGLHAEKGIFSFTIGLSRPLYTEVNGCWENISRVNGGEKTRINVHPEGQISPFFEVRVKIKKRIVLKFSYKELRWEKSEEDHVGGGVSVFQPKTNQKFFGFSAGILF